jgi:hypothetical protein
VRHINVLEVLFAIGTVWAVVGGPSIAEASPPVTVPAETGEPRRGHPVLTEHRRKNRAELYRAWAQTVDDWDAYGQTKYGAAGKTILAKLRSLGDSYVQLAVDPAISTRVEEFSAYIRGLPAVPESAWEARRRFAEKLGFKTTYRGMYMTDGEVQAARTHGLLPNLYSDPPERWAETLDFTMSRSLNDMLLDHMNGDRPPHRKSIILSVTAHDDAAGAIAKAYARGSKPGGKVVVFRCQVPALDLLHLHLPGASLPVLEPAASLLEFPESWRTGVTHNVIEIERPDGSRVQYGLDADLESFVQLKIDPDEIHRCALPLVLPVAFRV